MQTLVKLGLAVEYKKIFQFLLNEHKAVKKLMAGRTLSISQKNFIYVSSHEYTVTDEKPLNEKQWENHMWLATALSVLNGTGQQKIANLLGYSRETVNRKLKHNPFVRVINRFLTLEFNWKHQRLNQAQMMTILKRYPSITLLPDGTAKKQLPNEYQCRKGKKARLINLSMKTFRFSNRRFNKDLQFVWDSPKMTQLEFSKRCEGVPPAKRIATLRTIKKIPRDYIPAKKARGNVMTATKIIEAIYQPATRTYCIGRREYTNNVTVLKNIPGKWRQEIRRLSQELPLSNWSNRGIGCFEYDPQIFHGSLKQTQKKHHFSKRKAHRKPFRGWSSDGDQWYEDKLVAAIQRSSKLRAKDTPGVLSKPSHGAPRLKNRISTRTPSSRSYGNKASLQRHAS